MNVTFICIFYEFLEENSLEFSLIYSNFNYLVTVLDIFITIYYYGAATIS